MSTLSELVGGGGGGSEIVTIPRTSNTILTADNSSNFIDITSGTFTQTFSSAATLGDGWFCYIRNNGTGDITLDPSGSETIDGLTSFKMYPEEIRLIKSDGSNLTSVVLRSFYKTFTTSGTFTKPPGYVKIAGLLWGGGGSGAGASGYQGGGGGGACHPFNVNSDDLSASCSVVIGAGGVTTGVEERGKTGGTSSFDGFIYAYGGGGGNVSGQSQTAGGGGGSFLNAGAGGVSETFNYGGSPTTPQNSDNPGFGGGNGNGSSGANSAYGGAGGGGQSAAGQSLYGGGGGAGIRFNANSGGTSVYGGNGGDSGSGINRNGSIPGGGGGAVYGGSEIGGSGARGELRIWGIV